MQPVLPNVYISSWYTIASSGVLEDEGITHVVTVLTNTEDSERLRPFERLIIPVNDDPDEDLIDHFASTNQWIDNAIADGGKVLVHWYAPLSPLYPSFEVGGVADGVDSLAGKSRSATIVAAYLMQRFNIGVEEALLQITEVRNVDPNTGFREQLQVFLDCNFAANPTKAAYRHWRLRQGSRLQKGTPRQCVLMGVTVDITGKYGKPDDVNYAAAATQAPDSNGDPLVDLRCKKCRYSLLPAYFDTDVSSPPRHPS